MRCLGKTISSPVSFTERPEDSLQRGLVALATICFGMPRISTPLRSEDYTPRKAIQRIRTTGCSKTNDWHLPLCPLSSKKEQRRSPAVYEYGATIMPQDKEAPMLTHL